MRPRPLRVVRDGVQRLNHWFTATGVILLYHRIADAASDPYLLTVSPRHFDEQLRVLRRLGAPVHLDDIAHGLRQGRPVKRAIGVTFDDAYQDNLYTARPLLEQHEVPATVFATTGCGRSREFWWDELERIFLTPGALPATLTLELPGGKRGWQLGPAATWSEQDARAHAGWTFNQDAPPGRHAVFATLYEMLRPLPPAARTDVLDQIVAWAGGEARVRPELRALNPDELLRLEEGGLVEVGAHTVSHPSLPAHDAEVQSQEIGGSRATLAEWLGHPVRSFAYPYGHFNATSVDAARTAGFELACACLFRPIRRNTDPYLLPRIEVQDWDGDTFARRLRWYFGL